MNDSQTTLSDLRQLVWEFVERRDWHQFHAPKNLAMSLAIEAAELMEHFQWLTLEQSRAVAQEPAKLAAVGEELADVLCYALAMANELGLDVSTAIRDKMRKNERKYPAEEFRGRFGADDPGPTPGPSTPLRIPGLGPGAAPPGQPDAEAD
jgi:NTP pyrophosphatase (non-canonical NTP hydrolase)